MSNAVIQSNYFPNMKPKGVAITKDISDDEASFAATDFEGAEQVFIQVLGEDMYYTLDGSEADGSDDEFIYREDERDVLSVQAIRKMRLHRRSGSGGTGKLRAIGLIAI